MKPHSIIWTEETWNPVVGCAKISAGCKNCYAIDMAWRLSHIGPTKELYGGTVEKKANGDVNWTGWVKLNEAVLDKPKKKKKPTMFFVNSMSDLFHESVPFWYIDRIFDVMAACDHHTFQILTKRPKRMAEYFKHVFSQENISPTLAKSPLKNVWLGVSVENQAVADERRFIIQDIFADIVSDNSAILKFGFFYCWSAVRSARRGSVI